MAIEKRMVSRIILLFSNPWREEEHDSVGSVSRIII